MTKDQVIKRLKSDPRYLIQSVVFNNPNAVREKLSEYTDYEYDSVDEIINSVYEILEEGEVERIDGILTVPFLDENAKPVLIDAYEQLKSDRDQGQMSQMLDSSKGLYFLVKEENSNITAPVSTMERIKRKGICGCNKNPNSWCNRKMVGIKVKYLLGALILLIIAGYFLRKTAKIKINV